MSSEPMLPIVMVVASLSLPLFVLRGIDELNWVPRQMLTKNFLVTFTHVFYLPEIFEKNI
jgi:hypothetical protein